MIVVKIVKELFVDDYNTFLTAINSINWARLMAQVVYYYWSYLQINKEEINFIVPSGNFEMFFCKCGKKWDCQFNSCISLQIK